MTLEERLNAKPENEQTIHVTVLSPVKCTVKELVDQAQKCSTDIAKHLLGNLLTNYPTAERQASEVTVDRAVVEALLKNVEVKQVQDEQGRTKTVCEEKQHAIAPVKQTTKLET